MSTINLCVQLPSHTYALNLSIASSATITDLKHLIFVSCPGGPRAGGQRLFWRGRQLQDNQVVGEIWNTGEPHYTIHISVHQSAWTGTPPSRQTSFVAHSSSVPVPAAASPTHVPTSAPVSHPSPELPQALTYVHFHHINALRTLYNLPRVPWTGPGTAADAKQLCKAAIETGGRVWPAILDAEYPVPLEVESSGATFAITLVDNLPYLANQTPEQAPTAQQVHAAAVLSHTFVLLHPAPFARAQMIQLIQNNLAATVQAPGQLPLRPLVGLGALGAVALPQMPQIQLRALAAPVFLLVFRISILLYFFSPARQPVFAVLIALWGAWELWGAIRAAMEGADPIARAGGGGRPRPADNGPQAGPGVLAQPNAAAQGRPDAQAPRIRVHPYDGLVTLATLNLAAEAAVLVPGASPSPLPSIWHRTKTFFALFILSMHPAVWERRRRALRARETNLRQLYAASIPVPATTPSGEATEAHVHEPPPGWAAEYVQRVRTTEWVDE